MTLPVPLARTLALPSLFALAGCSSLLGLDEFREGGQASGAGGNGGRGSGGDGATGGSANAGAAGNGTGGSAAAGCEADVQNDASNCGACGHVCSTNNASATQCEQGVCKPTCNRDYADCSTPDPSNADDGCEVSLQDDGQNCSSCGRDCQGGECSAGVCQPLVLYEGVSGGRGIDVTDQEVIFSDDNDGRVYAIPKAGGSLRTVADGQAEAWYVKVDGSSAYWTLNRLSTGGISSGPVAGGTIDALVTGIDSPDSLAVGGGYVFYAPSGGNLFSVLSNGGAPVDLQFTGNAPFYYNGWLYFVSSASNGSVQRTSTSGGTPIDYATNLGLSYARYLFLEADVAVFAVANPKSEIYSVSQGGTPVALSDGHLASTMIVSNGWVFWSEWGTPSLPTLPGTIWGVSTTGGQPVALTDQGGFGINMAADDNAVYYSTSLKQNTYSILKIARP